MVAHEKQYNKSPEEASLCCELMSLMVQSKTITAVVGPHAAGPHEYKWQRSGTSTQRVPTRIPAAGEMAGLFYLTMFSQK